MNMGTKYTASNLAMVGKGKGRGKNRNNSAPLETGQLPQLTASDNVSTSEMMDFLEVGDLGSDFSDME